MLTIKKFFND